MSKIECGPENCPITAWEPLTASQRKAQRKPTAERMYKQGFTQQQIATQLKVSQMTVARDLEGLNTVFKPDRPKGGRPKGSRKPLSSQAKTLQPVIRAELEAGRTPNLGELRRQYGITDMPARRAMSYEQGRLAGLEEAAEHAPVAEHEPVEQVPILPKTAQAKLDMLVRREAARLAAEFDKAVQDAMKQWHAQREAREVEIIEQANKLISYNNGRRGPPFTSGEYHKVLWACHPDYSKLENAAEVFNLVRSKKLILCDDGPIHRKSADAPLPKTMEDLERRRRQHQQQQREARAAAKVAAQNAVATPPVGD
jgi:hypothetical protein